MRFWVIDYAVDGLRVHAANVVWWFERQRVVLASAADKQEARAETQERVRDLSAGARNDVVLCEAEGIAEPLDRRSRPLIAKGIERFGLGRVGVIVERWMVGAQMSEVALAVAHGEVV